MIYPDTSEILKKSLNYCPINYNVFCIFTKCKTFYRDLSEFKIKVFSNLSTIFFKIICIFSDNLHFMYPTEFES